LLFGAAFANAVKARLLAGVLGPHSPRFEFGGIFEFPRAHARAALEPIIINIVYVRSRRWSGCGSAIRVRRALAWEARKHRLIQIVADFSDIIARENHKETAGDSM
jgi:hypothetical protein